MNKTILVFLSLFCLVFFNPRVTHAACAPGECAGGYECQGGTMCCTGGGCPSWICLGGGNIWQQGNPPICRSCSTCYAWEEVGTKNVCTWEECGRTCYTATACPANNSEIQFGYNFLKHFGLNFVSEADSLAARCCVPKYCKSCEEVPVYGKVPYQCNCVYWAADASSGGTCEFCSGVPPSEPENPTPPCTNDPIGTRLLTDELSPSTFDTSQTINFSWRNPQSLVAGSWAPDWGVCCGTCTAGYDLYVNGVKRYSLSQATKSQAIAASVFGPGTHSWYVIAYNGAAGSIQSETKSFTVTLPTVSVEGYIWDSTGNACTYASKDSAEIQPSTISGSITPTVDTLTGTWDTAQAGKSYTVANVPQGNNKVLCASIPTPVGKPGFRYTLSCLNGASTGVFSGSCAYINASANPTRADLGYKLTSSGWYQVLGGGDVYAGCSSCIDSVSLGIPALGDILGGFTDALIANGGALFANSDVSVKNPSSVDKITSASGNKHYNKFMGDGSFWPENFSFTPPSSAQELTSNCGTMFTSGSLNPNTVYKTSATCFQSGIDNVVTSYRTSGDGVVVIYVTGGNTISFTRNFKSESANKRVMVVTESNIEVGSTVGEITPTTSTEANIQASLITRQSIRSLSNGSSTDLSLVIEGPLATKEGSISFDRDRGLQNSYPAQVVRYNPIYLTTPILSTSGVASVDISWTLQN